MQWGWGFVEHGPDGTHLPHANNASVGQARQNNASACTDNTQRHQPTTFQVHFHWRSEVSFIQLVHKVAFGLLCSHCCMIELVAWLCALHVPHHMCSEHVHEQW